MSVHNLGFSEMAGLSGATGSKTAFTYLATGTGTTAVDVTDATLGTEITDSGLARAAATVSLVTTTVTDDTLQLAKTFSVSGTKTIGEVGIFNASSSGTMGARTVLSPTKSVSSGDSYTLTYKVVFA